MEYKRACCPTFIKLHNHFNILHLYIILIINNLILMKEKKKKINSCWIHLFIPYIGKIGVFLHF